MQFCTKCVYPAASAYKLVFDEEGVCSGCRAHEEEKKIDWARRGEMLKELVAKYRSKDGSNYDCIIPVSGGKDSYYQTHCVTKVLGLKPLLVTYHGNNYLPEGEYNLHRMKEIFNVDHIIFYPNIDVLIKMNRLGFTKTGDMNWQNHCGILTYPIQIAVQHNIPLIVWGEHSYIDLVGMFSYDDFPEMSAHERLEHGLRGFDWYDFVGDKKETLREQDLLWAKYPSQEDIERVGVRGIYIGLFQQWDGYKNYKLSKELYGWKEANEPFERTYRTFSNLDDMHENGIHDYMKFIKFGYGRATDHACKDIRAGRMTRDEGIAMVKKYDHIKPRHDLERWLKYVGMSEEEFDRIADTFRDPRVWHKDTKGEWEKDNIWDEPSKK